MRLSKNSNFTVMSIEKMKLKLQTLKIYIFALHKSWNPKPIAPEVAVPWEIPISFRLLILVMCFLGMILIIGCVIRIFCLSGTYKETEKIVDGGILWGSYILGSYSIV